MSPNEKKVATEGHWYALGKEAGRKEAITELRALLKLDEAIADAIDLHERQSHGSDY